MTVASILKTKGADVVTVQGGCRMVDAVRLLREKHIGAVVVIGPGQDVLGILSERDVVNLIADHGAEALERPVSGVMSTKVRTCRPSDTIEHVMSEMTERRIRHIPVLDRGRLVGIVSIGDVVKRRIDAAETDVAALRDYISAG